MRFGSLRFTSAIALTLAFTACGGDGGTNPPPEPVPTTVTVTGGPVALSEIGQTATLAATVRDQDGDPIPDATLTFTSANTSVVTVTNAGVVTAVGDGSTTITARSGTVSAQADASVTITTLSDGVPVSGIGGASGSERLFTFDVPAGAGDGQVIEVLTAGGSGDVGLALKLGAPPSPSDFDCTSLASDFNNEFCIVSNPGSGEWNVLLIGTAAYSDVTVRVRLRPLTTLENGVPISDVSGQQGTFNYYAFDVPAPPAGSTEAAPEPTSRVLVGWTPTGEATSFEEIRRTRKGAARAPSPEAATTGARLVARTTGGTGDADLLGTPVGFLSQTAELQCLSQEFGNEDICVVEHPAAGPWQFALLAFETYTGVTLRVDYSAESGPIPGTVQIRKVVQSSTGGTANNPANPSLAGFEFEIRAAGDAAVVATVATDASGVAQASLPPGSYDVVESNPQGLTDVTVAADAIEVSEAATVEVEWINRQAPSTGPNGSPAAAINVSPTSVPAGDNNQTVVRLYGGNSTDPDGDPLTYQWSAPGGTFAGTTTGPFASVTFPGGSSQTVSLTVDDGEDQNTAQVQIAGGPALPAEGTFDIELVNADGSNPSAAVQTAFDLAEIALERIVRGDASDLNLNNIPPSIREFLEGSADDQCDIGTTAEGIVDDLRIYIDISPIDGPQGVLGQAGPCLVRTGGIGAGQISVGRMQFDSEDLNNFTADQLNRLILHEMFHVLGLGTLWPSRGLLENPSCAGGGCDENSPSPDTRYTGSRGVDAYLALGGGSTSEVPVENGEGTNAGPGARDGHWREVVFDTELMTGFFDGNAVNPISILTIQSLIDLGYTVAASEADFYAIPGPAPAAAFEAGPHIDLSHDMYMGPIWGIAEDGTITLVRPGR